VIYSVVCTNVNDYINWQCELLEYTWKRAKQPGSLIRLVNCREDTRLPEHRHARVVRVGSPRKRTRRYIAYERLFALQDWLRREQPEGSVLILDPDCVFRRPVETEVAPGAPTAQHWVDFESTGRVWTYRRWPWSRKRNVVDALYDLDRGQLQAATWPALIHTRDLERILPAWIEATRVIRAATGRWASDMLGFVIAAAESGLRFSLDVIGAFVKWPDELVGEAPIVHYCQDVYATDGSLLWAKRTYLPWEAVVGSEQAHHSYCRDLLAILNEYAALRRHDEDASGSDMTGSAG